MLNVAVAEVGLQGAGIVALVGQGIAAGVPKHVRVRLEGQIGLPASPFDPCLSGLLPIMLSGESTRRCTVSRR